MDNNGKNKVPTVSHKADSVMTDDETTKMGNGNANKIIDIYLKTVGDYNKKRGRFISQLDNTEHYLKIVNKRFMKALTQNHISTDNSEVIEILKKNYHNKIDWWSLSETPDAAELSEKSYITLNPDTESLRNKINQFR